MPRTATAATRLVRNLRKPATWAPPSATCTALAANATPRAGPHGLRGHRRDVCRQSANGKQRSLCLFLCRILSCGTASCTGNDLSTGRIVQHWKLASCHRPQSCPTNEKMLSQCLRLPVARIRRAASACVDTNTDGANCGICGKSCGSGSTCSAGKLPARHHDLELGRVFPFVFWVDASYVYYNDCSTYYDLHPESESRSRLVGGSGSSLTHDRTAPATL